MKRKIKQFIKTLLVQLNLIEGKLYLKPKKNLICGKKNYYFKGKFFIRDVGKVYFGNYCDIGHNLRLITTTHNINLPLIQTRLYWDYFQGDYPDPNKKLKSIRIGSDVWFGDNVTILPGVEIGDGAVIGTGSIVIKDVPPYAIVSGVPARIIHYRFKKEVIDFLLELKWWNWSEGKIKKNKEFFTTDLNKKDNINEIKRIIK